MKGLNTLLLVGLLATIIGATWATPAEVAPGQPCNEGDTPCAAWEECKGTEGARTCECRWGTEGTGCKTYQCVTDAQCKEFEVCVGRIANETHRETVCECRWGFKVNSTECQIPECNDDKGCGQFQYCYGNKTTGVRPVCLCTWGAEEQDGKEVCKATECSVNDDCNQMEVCGAAKTCTCEHGTIGNFPGKNCKGVKCHTDADCNQNGRQYEHCLEDYVQKACTCRWGWARETDTCLYGVDEESNTDNGSGSLIVSLGVIMVAQMGAYIY